MKAGGAAICKCEMTSKMATGNSMKNSADMRNGTKTATTKMVSASKRGGKIRNSINLNTISSTSRMRNQMHQSTTTREISSLTLRRTDDPTTTTTGTKTVKATSTCSTSLACSSSGPSRREQVSTALRMPPSSTRHQSTFHERINSMTQPTSVMVKIGSQSPSSPNSRLNRPRSCPSLPSRTVTSRPLSSQGRVA